MDSILKSYKNLSEDQRIEIQAGLEKGLDVSVYDKPEYLAIQMRQVRLGMEEGLDVSVYNKPEYDWFQMEEIRLGMKEGLACEIYAKPEIDYKHMRQIRKGLQEGIDLSVFVKLDAGVLRQLRKAVKEKINIVEYITDGYSVEQLVEIRHALRKKVDIKSYISKELRGASIQEICLGLEAGLPVDLYANQEYSWQQMREIRLGMEARIDVSKYCNSLFSWQQMREIRLGLEAGLDVDGYKRFIYTAADMAARREQLLYEETEQIIKDIETVKEPVLDNRITIFISNDEMEACIEVVNGESLTEQAVLNRLKQSGICQGILYEEVKAIIEEKKFGQTIVIAKGKAPTKGSDGWYEFFFDTAPSRTPNILEDGSADFKNIKWFELVNENQKVAYYHSASAGIAGYTVTGTFLKAKRGKEKKFLKGHGFRIESDERTYTASIDGKITLDGEDRLEISRICMVEDVTLATGNISFDGTIYVKGNVGKGVTISATDNVIVDGFVEGATIQSGGEVFLRNGVKGGRIGLIEAKGNVVGHFFEDISVITGGDIVAQYCMNCTLKSENIINLISPKGLLIGGTARAAKGISAFTVGNRNGLRTVLNVGIDKEMMDLSKKTDMEIENIHKELDILNRAKGDFQKKYAPEIRNSMERYIKIEDAIYTKELQLKAWNQKRQTIDDEMEERKGSSVTVNGTLYEGTEISVDDVMWKAFSVKGVKIKCVNGKISVIAK